MIIVILATLVLVASVIAIIYLAFKPVKTAPQAICLFITICSGLASVAVADRAYIASSEPANSVTHIQNLQNYVH